MACKSKSPRRDALHFFGEWVRNPREVASVVPSGPGLADLITRDFGPGTGPVLELGPGTGVFTEALVRRGVAERDLTLVEYGEGFADRLRARFPAAQVLRMDAAALGNGALADTPRFGGAICGLGLLNMQASTVNAIMKGAFDHMRPDAAFYLFTYGRRCSVSDGILRELGLTAKRVGTVIFNIPPASVYRITRVAS